MKIIFKNWKVLTASSILILTLFTSLSIIQSEEIKPKFIVSEVETEEDIKNPKKDSPELLPKQISLVVGESRVIWVKNLVRAAVGNPNIADILVVSKKEILINGKSPGTTTLTIWTKEHRLSYEILVTKEPLATFTRTFNLNNIWLKEYDYDFTKGAREITTKTNTKLLEELEKSLSTILEKDKFSINTELNKIVVQGTKQDLAKVEELLIGLDTKKPQALFEAKILEVAERDLKNIGLEWAGTKGKIGVSYDNTGGVIRFDTLGSYTEQYLATLQALESEGKTRILANPKIVAIQGKLAHMVIGDKFPIIEVTYDQNGRRTETASYIEVGIILSILLTSTSEDGYVTALVGPEVSKIIDWKGNYPLIGLRHATSEVRLKDGESLVISGLLNSEEIKTIKKVPVLGDIPILSSLFRNVETQENKTEIIIIITPHILH